MKFINSLVGVSILVTALSVGANPGILKERKLKKVKIDSTSKDADKVSVARVNYHNKIEKRSSKLIGDMEGCSSTQDEAAAECRKSVLEGKK